MEFARQVPTFAFLRAGKMQTMGHRWSQRESLFGLPWFELLAEERLFKGLKLACVYVLGPQEARRPIKIGWTSDPIGRFWDLQVGNPAKVQVFDVAWVAGAPLAKRLEKTTHAIMDRKFTRLNGEWFDARPEDAMPALQAALDASAFPSLSHSGMLDQVQTEHERRVQAAVAEDMTKMRRAA